jgi:hypothetical protein
MRCNIYQKLILVDINNKNKDRQNNIYLSNLAN